MERDAGRLGVGAAWLPVVAVLAVAVGLRAPALAMGSWSIDPFITWTEARKPLLTSRSLDAHVPPHDSIVGFCLHDTGPGPLAYLLEGLLATWAHPLGGEHWLIVPSIVAGVGLVAAVLGLGRHLCGRRVGAIAMAACCASCPLFVEASGVPRGYNWALLALVGQLASVRSILGGDVREDDVLRRRWGAFLALSGIAFLIHPLSLAASGALGAAVALRCCRRDASTARLSPRWVLGGGAVLALVVLLYVHQWAEGLAAAGAGGGRAPDLGAVPGKLSLLMGEFFAGWGALHLAFGAAVAALGWRTVPDGDRRVLLWAGGLALVAELALALVFLTKFFAAMRHFYPVPLVLFWGIGMLAGPAWEAVRGRRWATSLATAGLALVLVLPAWTAVGRVRAPSADWAALIRLYTAVHRPDDLVLIGPNSELDLFWAYAQAAGIPLEVAPRTVTLPDGSRLDLQTEAGVRAVIASGRRTYFFTSFWGMHRPASYWAAIEENFRELEPIPGRFVIRAWRREVGAGGSQGLREP